MIKQSPLKPQSHFYRDWHFFPEQVKEEVALGGFTHESLQGPFEEGEEKKKDKKALNTRSQMLYHWSRQHTQCQHDKHCSPAAAADGGSLHRYAHGHRRDRRHATSRGTTRQLRRDCWGFCCQMDTVLFFIFVILWMLSLKTLFSLVFSLVILTNLFNAD